MLTNSPYVFVYGTLMRGFTNPVAKDMAAMSRFVAEATASGSLYDMGDYPGAIFGDSNNRLFGEVYEVTNPSLWPVLDAYEGCAINDHPPYEYQRIIIDCTLVCGTQLQCWAYQYQWSTDSAVLIPSGDYRRLLISNQTKRS